MVLVSLSVTDFWVLMVLFSFEMVLVLLVMAMEVVVMETLTLMGDYVVAEDFLALVEHVYLSVMAVADFWVLQVVTF